jgi:hypothetical protein
MHSGSPFTPNRHDSEVIYKRWRDRIRPHTAR